MVLILAGLKQQGNAVDITSESTCLVSRHLVFKVTTDAIGVAFAPHWFVKASKLLHEMKTVVSLAVIGSVTDL